MFQRLKTISFSISNFLIRNSSSRNKRFVDKAKLNVRGGRGGNGCVSYEVLAPGRKRANGGSGGLGGNIYLVASIDKDDLSFDTFHYNAGDGKHGSSDKITGRRGKDVFINVPCGTIVMDVMEQDDDYNDFDWDDEDDDDDNEDDNGNVECSNAGNGGYDDVKTTPISVIDLDEPGDRVLVAVGGVNGVGNGVLSRGLGKCMYVCLCTYVYVCVGM